jgi:hypothetical protein
MTDQNTKNLRGHMTAQADFSTAMHLGERHSDAENVAFIRYPDARRHGKRAIPVQGVSHPTYRLGEDQAHEPKRTGHIKPMSTLAVKGVWMASCVVVGGVIQLIHNLQVGIW